MRTIEMILMTKSSKYGAYCVAGFDVSEGRWVRLVSEDEDTHGAIDDEMLFDRAAGRCADVLDHVRVEIEGDVPSSVQTENVLVRGTGKIRILRRAKIGEAVRLHPFEERDALFSSHRYVVEADISTIHHSLEFVQATNLHLYTVTGSSGKPKYKADFECGGRRYTTFAMTDPAYYEKKNVWLDHAALALSISDDEWSRANGHYIYVAKIFDLTKKKRPARIILPDRRILGRIGAGAAAALVILLLGLWISKMDKVYVPPHTGARYHAARDCVQMTNPQAARAYPAFIGRILFRPCGECGQYDTEG